MEDLGIKQEPINSPFSPSTICANSLGGLNLGQTICINAKRSQSNEEQLISGETLKQACEVVGKLQLSEIPVSITNQPNNFKFRHESEKQHAMAIKGPKIDGKDTWPEIRISDAKAYAASIWIQLVEKENKKDSQPRPSPNGLFLKKDKNGHVYSPNGIEIDSDGNDDGVVKLIIPNLDTVGRKITFDDKLPLAMFRAKQCDLWKYLRKKNDVNETVIASQRVSLIPKNLALEELKKEVDTTRVRLCFQVNLHYQMGGNEPLNVIQDPICSDLISDIHAHPPLWIDDSAPIIASDLGIDHCIILHSKIEETDINNLCLVFKFKNKRGEEISVRKNIPSKKENPSLRHCQTALKFGKRHNFEMPAYHDKVEKLEAKTHAHGTMRLCKYLADEESNQNLEIIDESNPIDVIVFPHGYKEQLGKCIGNPITTTELSCSFKSQTDIMLEDVISMENIKTINYPNNVPPSSAYPLKMKSQNASTSTAIQFNPFSNQKIVSLTENASSRNSTINGQKRKNSNPGKITLEKL